MNDKFSRYAEHKFKVGDIVKREYSGDNGGMIKGETYKIESLYYDSTRDGYSYPFIRLEGLVKGYSERFFSLVQNVDACVECGKSLLEVKTDSGYTINTSLTAPNGDVIKLCYDCMKNILGD